MSDAVASRQEYPDGWVCTVYLDGTWQWYMMPMPLGMSRRYIERVLRPGSRRKRWVIVSRDGADNSMYPPKISGPFPNLESAKAAYLVITSAR